MLFFFPPTSSPLLPSSVLLSAGSSYNEKVSRRNSSLPLEVQDLLTLREESIIRVLKDEWFDIFSGLASREPLRAEVSSP